jgi:hypothetical protein
MRKQITTKFELNGDLNAEFGNNREEKKKRKYKRKEEGKPSSAAALRFGRTPSAARARPSYRPTTA